MATNDFLVFAGVGGANVITQAQYVALLAEATGFQSGIASSAQANKVFRQSSIISSMIGQFIVDETGSNATDDGTTATLEANFILALQAVTFVKLSTVLNLYVNASTGVDTNNGRSPSLPFRTIQAAVNSAYINYNFNNNALIINCASGTYTNPVVLQGMPIGCPLITILGNVSSPASVVVNVSNANAFIVNSGAIVAISGVSISATGTSSQLVGLGYGVIGQQGTVTITNCIFNSCTTIQIQSSVGAVISVASTTFAGSSGYGLYATGGGLLWGNGAALTFSSASYSGSTVNANICGNVQLVGATFFGSATGSRYNVTQNGIISTNSAGANFIPGNSAGVAATGGLYV